MNGRKEFLHISQKYNIISPAPGKAYPILCKDWDHLKEQISQIKDGANIYNTIASLLIGAGLSTLVTILSGGFSPDQSQGSSTRLVIAWACVVVLIFCGIISFYFSSEKKKVNQIKASDIVEQMQIIEERYQNQPLQSCKLARHNPS